MLRWIEQAVGAFGYPAVALLMALENVFPPIPSEVIMPLAGWATERGPLTLAGVVFAGTAGSLLGSLVLYALGARLGAERLRAWTARHGHWVLLTTADFDRTIAWFRNRGVWAVLVARLVPGIRSLVSVPAGAARMPLGRFVGLTALGTVVWVGALAWLGRILGPDHGLVERYLGPAAAAVLGALAVAYVVRALRMRRRRPAEGGPPTP